jgi:uncharacterized membrane protein YraQ (UPF0718 family)
VDTESLNQLKDFLLNFTGILYEALPWVVIGALFAGLVQELPSRRAPAVMLALGLAILILTVGPIPYSPDYDKLAEAGQLTAAQRLAALAPNAGLAAVVALAAGGAMLLAQRHVDRVMAFLGAHRNLAIGMSGFLGLVNPMCDCGIIVVMRRLLRKGMPLSCCVTYILAGPIVNVLVMATTWEAFRWRYGTVGTAWMLGFRCGMGLLTAIVTGLIVERMYRRHGAKLLAPTVELPTGLPVIETDEYGEHERPRSLFQRVSNISETALHDFVDVLVPLIIGALLAAGVKGYLSKEQIESVSAGQPLLAIGLMMLVGFLITLCSETDAFVIAPFTLKPAAKLAFLVLGPMFDLKLFFMYTRVFRPRLMWTIILSISVQIFIYCYLTHLVWESYGPVPAAATAAGAP